MLLDNTQIRTYNYGMNNLFMSHHPRRHAKSFKYAFSGLLHTLINEPNFRVQLVFSAATVYFGFKYDINNLEWSVLIVANGLLLSAEMINTVVENFIDVLINNHNNSAKIIKDVSAGFVMITSIVLLLVFLLIFYHRFF